MSKPLTEKTTDNSDGKNFAFSFFCDICGREWKSPPEPYTNGGFTAIGNEEARQMIWAQEHKAAFEHANLEAHLHFNRCPQCGKSVCDDCFILEKEVCKECG